MPDRWLAVASGLLLVACCWLAGCGSAVPASTEHDVTVSQSADIDADTASSSSELFPGTYRVIPADRPRPEARSAAARTRRSSVTGPVRAQSRVPSPPPDGDPPCAPTARSSWPSPLL